MLVTPIKYAEMHDKPIDFVMYAIREGRLPFHLVRRGNRNYYFVPADAIIEPSENNLIEGPVTPYTDEP